MEFGVGLILEGKVTGITKFGAFVSLPEGKSGLVHISEIAYSYVNDVSEHLSEGQEVKVKVIGIDESGRINLSIKKAMDPPPRPAAPAGGGFNRGPGGGGGGFNRGPGGGGGGFNRGPRPGGAPGGFNRGPAAPKEPATFEDKLKLFMQSSDSKLSEMKANERKGSNRRGGGGGRK